MKVYVVIEINYSGFGETKGVFKNEKDADKFLIECGEDHFIEQHEVIE